MWIHESFTNYSESLFLDYHYGKEAGQAYVRGTRMNIANDMPIIGIYGLNKRGSGDMYYKGGNLLNMIRQILQDDEKWRQILRSLNQKFYHQTVTTEEIETYISKEVGLDLGKVFDQYLRDIRIPIFEYYAQDGMVYYRWINAVNDFDMPVDVTLNGKIVRLQPKTTWQSFGLGEPQDLIVDPDYYVGVLKSRE